MEILPFLLPAPWGKGREETAALTVSERMKEGGGLYPQEDTFRVLLSGIVTGPRRVVRMA